MQSPRILRTSLEILMHCAAGQAGAAPQPPCLGISSSHSCNSLEDAGLGLFVPSGAERAYFRLPCTLHSSVPLLYKAAELVRTAVHTEIWVYIKSKHELGILASK